MLDRDERPPDEIHGAINWSQNHEFWKSVVLSMPKLREKYDQMKLQAKRTLPASRQQQTDDMFDRAMERAQAREAAS